MEQKGPANAANAMVCVVHQTNFLLDRLLRQLERAPRRRAASPSASIGFARLT